MFKIQSIILFSKSAKLPEVIGLVKMPVLVTVGKVIEPPP
jgi:hypothetical protein